MLSANADCNVAIKPSTPYNRFTINADNTVIDNITGLMWMRCSLGQVGEKCSGTASSYDWFEALNQNGKNFAGYDDWRLPNIKELESITELGCIEPAVNTKVFPKTISYIYWTSSPSGGDFAQYVHFGYGDILVIWADNTPGHVRLVRGGQ